MKIKIWVRILLATVVLGVVGCDKDDSSSAADKAAASAKDAADKGAAAAKDAADKAAAAIKK